MQPDNFTHGDQRAKLLMQRVGDAKMQRCSMATRRTITIDPFIYDWLQKLRARFIESGIEMSFTTAANLVLYGGMRGSDYFQDEDWRALNEFLADRGEDLELDSATDMRADHYLNHLVRLDHDAS